MKLTRVIFKNLDSTFTSVSIGGIRFKDKHGRIIPIHAKNVIINSAQIFENDIVRVSWAKPPRIFLSALYPVNAITTDRPQTSYNWLVFPTYTQSLTKPNDLIIEFKNPVEVSAIEFVPLPDRLVKTGITKPFVLEIYEQNKLVFSQTIKPIEQKTTVQSVKLGLTSTSKPREQLKEQPQQTPKQPKTHAKQQEKTETHQKFVIVYNNKVYITLDKTLDLQTTTLQDALKQSQLTLNDINSLVKKLKGKVKVISDREFKVSKCLVKQAILQFSRPIHLETYCPKLVNFELIIRSSLSQGQVGLKATIYTGQKTYNLVYDKEGRQFKLGDTMNFIPLSKQTKLTSIALPLEIADILTTNFDITVQLEFRNLRCGQRLTIDPVKLTCAKHYVYTLLQPQSIELEIINQNTIQATIVSDRQLNEKDLVLLKILEQ